METLSPTVRNELVPEQRKSLKERAAKMFNRVLAKVGIVDAPAEVLNPKNEYFNPTEEPKPEQTVNNKASLFADRSVYTGGEPINPAKEQLTFRKSPEGLFGGEAVNDPRSSGKTGVQEAFDPHGDFQHLRPSQPSRQPIVGHYAPEENPFRPDDNELYS